MTAEVDRGSVAAASRLQLERVVSAVALGGGIALITAGARYGLSGPTGVGPGTFPAIAGALMVLSSLLQAKHLLPHRGDRLRIKDIADGEATETLPDRTGLVRVGVVVVSTVVAALVLDRLGFVISVGLYLTVVLKVVGHRSWARSVLVGMVVALVIGEVFSRGLGVSLPTTSIGFLQQLGI